MNGTDRFFLDTNAIVSLLRGEESVRLIIAHPQWIGISIISHLEFLSFPNLNECDRELFKKFSQQVDVIGLDIENRLLMQTIVDMRRQYRLKLPDAIIAATAVCQNATLVTADRDFQSLPDLSLRLF